MELTRWNISRLLVSLAIYFIKFLKALVIIPKKYNYSSVMNMEIMNLQIYNYEVMIYLVLLFSNEILSVIIIGFTSGSL